MGIFDRLSTLIKSNLNDLISSAENPEKMLNQIIIDMRTQLAKAKQQVAGAIADERRLHDQVDAEYKQVQDWEKRAMLAVQEGRDDMAKQALMRHNEHMTHAQQLEATWHAHKAETEKLKGALRELNDKIEEAKRKKNLLIARQKRAEALLVGDRGGHLLLGLRELRAHVHENLVQHLLRILGGGDEVVDVRTQQRRKSVEDTHAQRPSRYDENSRRCDASASVMLS